MEVINYEIVFNEPRVAPTKEFVSSVGRETVEIDMDNYAKPVNFFRGAVLAFILSLPFWSVLLWFIFT
jgi:hypothetical protein